MYALLAVAVSVSSQRVEENLYTNLRSSHMTLMDRMAKGEVAAFEEAFVSACPKFVTTTAPNFAALREAAEKAAKEAALAGQGVWGSALFLCVTCTRDWHSLAFSLPCIYTLVALASDVRLCLTRCVFDSAANPTPTEAAAAEKAKGPSDGEDGSAGPASHDMTALQTKMFLVEMNERKRLPEIYSYLKLCTNVSLQKLSDFLHIDQATCLTELLCLKHKTRSLRWRGTRCFV